MAEVKKDFWVIICFVIKNVFMGKVIICKGKYSIRLKMTTLPKKHILKGETLALTKVRCSVRNCKFWGKGEVCTAESIWVNNDLVGDLDGMLDDIGDDFLDQADPGDFSTEFSHIPDLYFDGDEISDNISDDINDDISDEIGDDSRDVFGDTFDNISLDEFDEEFSGDLGKDSSSLRGEIVGGGQSSRAGKEDLSARTPHHTCCETMQPRSRR